MFKTTKTVLKTENLDEIVGQIFDEAFNAFRPQYGKLDNLWSKVRYADDGVTTIKVALPGIRKDLVDIQAEDFNKGGKLTISIGNDKEYDGPVSLPLSRYVTFLDPINVDNVDASFENGILTIIVKSRKEETPNSKKVTIK